MAETSKSSQDGLTFTCGELFKDDGGMDVLTDNQLVLWRHGCQEVASTLAVDGHNYVAAPLEPSLTKALRFPRAPEDFGGTSALMAEVEAVLRSYTALDTETLLPLAAFVLATWLPECTPTAPLLNICGALGAESALVEVLGCLCRRPLVVADASSEELCALPGGLCPTVIATQPSKRTIQNLLAAAATAQPTLLRGGRLIASPRAAVLCTRMPLPAPAYSVRLLPGAAPYRRTPAAEAEQLTERLAPRLLHYRLSQHSLISHSSFDCPRFAPETRLVGRVLGSALEGAPELQARLLAALAPIDEQHQAEHSEERAALVVEALLALCKEEKPVAYVEEITQLVNVILLGRHERLELSAKKVGAILRRELGLHAARQAHGYQLVLDAATQRRLERLAEVYGVLSWQEHANADNVHDVHDVHDVDGAPSPKDANQVHDVHHVHDLYPGAVGEGQLQ